MCLPFMRKDIIIAVGIGFVLGSAVAIFLINLPNIFKQESKLQLQNMVASPTPSESTKTAESTPLVVDQPSDNQIFSEKNITVSGKYPAGNTIIIETDDDVKLVKVSPNGEFSEKINIPEGASNIYLTAYNNDQELKTQILTVFYTPEKL